MCDAFLIPAMEQIYNCFTWYNLHRDKPLVMVYPPGQAGFHDQLPRDFVTRMYSKFTPAAGDSAFLTGFTEAMGDFFNITFTTEAVGPSVSQKLYIKTHRYFHMKPSDLRELTDGILTYHAIPRVDCNGGSSVPRIGILNRQKKYKRTILNVHEVAGALQSAFNRSALIPIKTLEDASFAEQLEFFASHDIVIAPHGAALTAVPFMPRCGAFLEIFPKHFFMPHYFGSLAESSDLKQYYMYESLGNGTAESGGTYHMLQGKRKNLCLDAGHVVSAVRKMVANWQMCCRDASR
jgi:Glycosyltransferase 61